MGKEFGARLRQRREARGIGLDVVACQTKIKRSLLEALERDDISAWPRGFFGRAFVRAYAQAVGLDPDGAVRDFLAAFPDMCEAADRLATSGLPPEPSPVVLAHGHTDLPAVAHLCTELGRVARVEDLPPLLEQCAGLLEAKGLIVWVWDESAEILRPALGHGYPDRVFSRLPVVTRDSENATAEAFRTARTCVINRNGTCNGALAVPLLTPAGCSGVLAIEFEGGAEHTSAARAVSTIMAAMLAQLFPGEVVADAEGLAARQSA